MSFDNDWNTAYEASPANSDNASEGAGKIRGFKGDIRQRFNVDHYIGNVAVSAPSSDQISNSDSGYHRQVTLGEKSSPDYTAITGYAELFALVANGTQLPFFINDDDQLRSVQPMISRTLVPLTSVATVNLFLVPTNATFLLTDIWLEGETAQTGGTASTLKIGVSGTLDQLNTTSGHAFTSASATTLLPVGQRMKVSSLYPPSNMNDILVKKFAATNQLIADVSGTVVTAGKVYVELWGILIEV